MVDSNWEQVRQALETEVETLNLSLLELQSRCAQQKQQLDQQVRFGMIASFCVLLFQETLLSAGRAQDYTPVSPLLCVRLHVEFSRADVGADGPFRLSSARTQHSGETRYINRWHSVLAVFLRVGAGNSKNEL